MIAKTKLMYIINKSNAIEDLLCNKYKKMNCIGTFGSKVKYYQEKNPDKKNINSILWIMVHIRNNAVHNSNLLKIKDYNLFIALEEYILKSKL